MPGNGRNKLDEVHRPALAVVLRYAVFGAAWILLSDRLLAMAVPDPRLQELLQTLKGWFFIGVTAALLYGLVYRELAVRQALRKAADAERDRQEDLLRKALAERESLLAEVHHRVRNNLQVMDSLMNLERHRVQGERNLAGFDGLRARIRAMSLVHDQLFRSGDLDHVAMGEYVESLLSNLWSSSAGRYEIRCGGLRLSLDDAVPFGLLLTELALNAIAHAGPKAVFSVEAVEEGGRIRVIARDDGPGFPQAAPVGDGSMGLALVESLARQLGGPVSFANEDGARIEFWIARRGADVVGGTPRIGGEAGPVS